MPLAPGYQIKEEALSVHFISGDSPHLAVQVEYTLANTGSTPLHFIDVALPSSAGFGSANFVARINGSEVRLPPPSSANSQTRIPLPFAWRQKQKIALALSYDLAAAPPADPRILVSSKMFLLNDSGWFPALLPFKAFLSPKISRPNRIDCSIFVPAGFRVTASGQPRGAKKQNGELEYRFRIGKKDFNPYVLAGEYNEQRVSASNHTVVFWTFTSALPAQILQTAAQIARARDFFSRTFGALPKAAKQIYDVEIPAGNSPSGGNSPLIAPPAAIIVSSSDSHSNSQSFVTNTASNSAAAQLAATWFNHVIRPRPEAWTLGLALAAYASAQFANANNTSRRDRIASTLADYGRTGARAVEKPALSLTQSDPAAQQQLAADKLALFFGALEDKCGQQNLSHAISDMVYALRGENYGYNDFRAALEDRCHQDLAGFFREWLAQPGIPPDFRARYGNSGVK